MSEYRDKYPVRKATIVFSVILTALGVTGLFVFLDGVGLSFWNLPPVVFLTRLNELLVICWPFFLALILLNAWAISDRIKRNK